MFLEDKHYMVLYTEEDKQAVKKEIGLKDNVLEEDINAIIEWFKKQPHLAEAPIDRDFVERILISAKGSREKAKYRIDNFYKYRALAPELIQSRVELLSKTDENIWTFLSLVPITVDKKFQYLKFKKNYVDEKVVFVPENARRLEKFRNDPDVFHQGIVPQLYNGKRVSFISFESDPSTFDTEVLYRNIILLGDFRLKYDYMFNDIWVVDLNNAGFGHLMRYNPIIFQKAVNIYQEGLGVRVSKIHCVNAPVFGHHVANFMKKFVKAKLMERVIIHDSLESLHKHLPKQYLPKDYGGDLPTLKEYSDNFDKEFRTEKTKKTLIDFCQLVSDESKRPREKYNEEAIVGSFKKLDFD